MLMWHAFIWQPVFPAKEPEKYCEGTPLYVQYPYESGYLEPHACKVQCETPSEQRFVLYSNGKATQCEKIPGCLDAGEDSGVTCTVPDAYKMSSQETT